MDIGALADSWRSEPNRPVYVQPYLAGKPPKDATPEQGSRWALDNPGIAVPTDQIRKLTDSAVRGVAGGYLASLES